MRSKATKTNRNGTHTSSLCKKKLSAMYKFEEIIGAHLEGISESTATYVDACEIGASIKNKGLSMNFDKGWFVIENPFTLTGISSVHEIIGATVVDAFTNDDEILVRFDNGAAISVSLKDDDFAGPEAASYVPKRGEIIVFD